MTKKRTPLLFSAVLITLLACNNSVENDTSNQNKPTVSSSKQNKEEQDTEINYKSPSELIPEGYVIFEKMAGDLNKDGLKDSILIVKSTNPKNIIVDEYLGKLDRNRRGILIFIHKKDHFELMMQNLSCFSSENEDGGVYFAPELSVEVRKGNLFIHYSHGRYGYWQYNFRLKNSEFELIGYSGSENDGPIILHETSINYLTKKKQERVNINEEAESGEEIFEEKWSNIKLNQLLKLSQVKDFDVLDPTGVN